jgi:hypothetical protein
VIIMRQRRLGTVIVSAAALAQLLPVTVATAADPPPVVFSYTGAQQQFVVPANVTSIHVLLVGGKGGGYLAGGTVGGFGARVEGDLAVFPGAAVFVMVGGNGLNVTNGQPTPGGFNGGGAGGTCGDGFRGASGGGASDVRTTSSPDPSTNLNARLMVAAGGGAGGDVANGGSGGATGATGSGSRAGGGATAAGGGYGGGGQVGEVVGQAGDIGLGGAGASSTGACAAGGGGGYYGGGGGGALVSDPASGGGSGGGGSSTTGPATNAVIGADNSGDPRVVISFAPQFDRGSVGADVDVRSSEACLLLSTNQVSFGTLSLGDEDKAAGPEIMIKNCSGNTEDVFASGTAATGTGASWSLVDSAETCADTLGTDRYRLALHSIEFAAPIGLTTDPKAVTTLPSEFVSTETARIFMACPGSSGGGETMSMSINYLAVENP